MSSSFLSLLCLLCLLCPAVTFGQEAPKSGNRAVVSVNSTTVAVSLFTGILASADIQPRSDAAISILLCEINQNETCASVVSRNGCKEIYPAQIYTYEPGQYGGAACGLLKSGSTAVLVDVSTK